MKIKELLNKKLEMNSLLDSSPFGWMSSVYDRIFGKKMTAKESRDWWNQNLPGHRNAPPPPARRSNQNIKTLKVEKEITGFTKIYGQSTNTGISMQLIKKAMINDLIEKASESDQIEFNHHKRVNTFGVEEEFISAEIHIVCKNN